MRVAIIGAGINGLYLAWKLSSADHKVTVFEKKEKIGKIACSGLFSERILKLIPESRKLIQNEINSVLIHFPKKTIRVEFSKQFLVMSHFALDNLVADLAKSAGAEIITSRTVDSIPEEFDRVIGCDGPNSAVRKILNLKEPQCRLAIQGFISGEEDKSSSSPFAATRVSDMVETWPIKNGFIWRIPRGGETEYGAIGNSKEVKSIFDAYLQKNNLQLERLASALVPNGLIVPANGLITLCGDAVGLTKPWSGGGVIWGLLAANLLLKDFPDFIRYKNAVKIFFWPRLLCSKIITKIVYFLGFNFPWLLPEKIKIESDFLI